MPIGLLGPINSGAAVGSNGAATANNSSTVQLWGEVLAIYVKYNDSPPAGTTDVTVTTVGTSPAPPATTLQSLPNAATDGWFYPRTQIQTTAGTGLTYDGTNKVEEPIPVCDYVNVKIDQANAADNVDVWILYRC